MTDNFGAVSGFLGALLTVLMVKFWDVVQWVKRKLADRKQGE